MALIAVASPLVGSTCTHDMVELLGVDLLSLPISLNIMASKWQTEGVGVCDVHGSEKGNLCSSLCRACLLVCCCTHQIWGIG
eukprot:1160437-Pelagomonas_calceolata.AAC.2